jgi:hypothetical protein
MDPIAFGRMLQQRGFRVSENSAFNGGRRVTSGHVKGSDHYRDRAFDVNYGPGGTSKTETDAINGIIGLAKKYGIKYIWQAPGHYNHAHLNW